MNKAWWVLLAGAISMASALAGSSREFLLALPAGIDAARSVVLVLSEVRLPRNVAVVLRARVVETRVADSAATEISLGSTGLLAESKTAEGSALHATLRIDVTKALQRWRHDHPDAGEIRIRVAPYAGAKPLPDLEWSTASAALSFSGD